MITINCLTRRFLAEDYTSKPSRIDYLVDNMDVFEYNYYGDGMIDLTTTPNADGILLDEIEYKLQELGLHPKCEKCSKSCVTYNARGLSRFYCGDFIPRNVQRLDK